MFTKEGFVLCNCCQIAFSDCNLLVPDHFPHQH